MLASWKAPDSPWIVEVSALSSGIGWILLVSLSALLLAFFLGRSKDASGAVWRRRHAALHIRVFWSLSRALAFLLGAAAVLLLAHLFGHSSAGRPAALAALLLLEFAWYLWCIHQMAEPLRVEGHTLVERE